MFDPFYEAIASLLAFCYGLVPNFAIAIIMLTMIIMVVTTPLTLKGTRSMIKMQIIQPEMRRLQIKYKDDREKLNQELMRFYQEEGINPVGGCLPLLAQAPVFLLLFGVIRGLTRTPSGSDGFDPRYVDHETDLFRDLEGQSEMLSFGFDLARSTTEALGDSIIQGIPYVLLILGMAGATVVQQLQISRRSKGPVPTQQKIIQWAMPIVFPLISLNFAAALLVYWTSSNIYRIGVQYYITHTLYRGDDSLGKQAQKASEESRKLQANGKGGAKGGKNDAKAASDNGADDGSGRATESGSSNSGSSNGGVAAAKPHSRSKKKRKRR